MSLGEHRPPKRARFRFGLRTMFIACALVALVLGWWLHYVWLPRHVLARLQTMGTVAYDVTGNPASAPNWLAARVLPPRPIGLRLVGSEVNDALLDECVSQFPSLEHLSLEGTRCTADGLLRLQACTPRLSTIRFLQSGANLSRLLSEIEQPTMLELVEIPLDEAIAYLHDSHGLPIVIDAESIGIRPADAVILAADIRNVALGVALDQVLSPLEMGWVLRDGALVITSRAKADRRRDLVRALEAAFPQTAVDDPTIFGPSVIVDWAPEAVVPADPMPTDSVPAAK